MTVQEGKDVGPGILPRLIVCSVFVSKMCVSDCASEVLFCSDFGLQIKQRLGRADGSLSTFSALGAETK